jgi:hypothetical protein
MVVDPFRLHMAGKTEHYIWLEKTLKVVRWFVPLAYKP